MPEPLQQPSFTPSQPPQRPVVASPLQRSNYGIPPRQSAAPAFMPPRPMTRPPQPLTQTGPRMMDVAAPAPAPLSQPVAAPQPIQPAFVPSAAPAPVQQPVAAAPLAAPITPVAQTPLFTAARSVPEPKRAGKTHGLRSKLRIPLLVVGVLLVVFGGVRMVMAGSTSGYTVAVGAVTANDGQKTTIQFTANDGILHRFTRNHSVRNQIPGTAVQVAYQPGAADATVKEVSTVKGAQKAGLTILLVGIVVSLVASGGLVLNWLKNRASRPKNSQAVPVTA